MTTITHRVGNTRNLTPAEVDANFDRLNTDVEALQAAPPSGVTAYTALSDAATAALPTINSPLVTALSLKATTASVALKANTSDMTAALALKANTSDMTTALALKVPTSRTVNSLPLSSNITLSKTDIGLANVDNTTDLNKPVSTATATALALRAPGGTLITYTGTGRSLANTDNGNIVRCTNASAVSMTVPSGLEAGFTCLLVQGNTGVVTAVQGSGVALTANDALVTNGIESDILIAPSGTNTYVVHSPTEAGNTMAALTDVVTYNLGTNNTSVAAIKATADAAQVASLTAEAAQDAVAASLAAGTHVNISVAYNDGTGAISLSGSGGGTTIAVISGTRGTGNTLTATPATGWVGTYQWQSYHTGDWNNVGSGGTSATHVELIADVARDIRCVFTPATFNTNTLLQPAPVFTAQSPPDGEDDDAYSYSYVATGATSYAVASGTLPTGLSLNTTTGAITGTPTTPGTYTFVISATNTGGTTNASSQDVVIAVASGSGALSVSKLTAADQNLTTYGTVDWQYFGINSGNDDYKASATSGAIGTSMSHTGHGRGTGGAATYATNWTDGFDDTVYTKSEAMLLHPLVADEVGYTDFLVPAGTGERKARILLGAYTGGRASANIAVRFHLSDSSAADVDKTDVNIDVSGYGTVSTLYEATYTAGSAAQTLRIRVENTDGEGTDFALYVQSITHGTV